jgi:cleavage stimulation factor subunit 1
MIRLYDCVTLQAYTAADAKDHHFKPINQVRYSPDGSVFASCSKDGYIKIWDAINNRVVRLFAAAHGGSEVSSVQFTRNNKYLLSCGKDSTIRLWDMATGRQLKNYTGGVSSKNRLQACFNYNEDMIFGSDEKANSALVWDSRSGELRQRLTGHNNLVRWIASSPVDNAIITCSDDHRARYWTA